MRRPSLTFVALVCVVAALLAVASACPSDPRDDEPQKVVATAGNAAIERPELVAELSRAGVARIDDAAAKKRLATEVLERMVRQELLFQAAEAAGVTASPSDVERELGKNTAGYPAGMFQRVLHAEQLTFEQYQYRVKRRYVVERFLKDRFASLPRPTEEELQQRYEAMALKEPKPERVRARQILLKTPEEAEHILSQVKSGALSFAEAAKKLSEAPEKEVGGDLGWFAKGQMPPVFDVCFTLEKGKLSDVVASEFGFHIFQVTDKKAGGLEPFDQARTALEALLVQERQEASLEAYAKELREKAKVTISEDAFEAALAQLPEQTLDEERGPDAAPPAGDEEPLPDDLGAAIKTAPRAKPLPGGESQ